MKPKPHGGLSRLLFASAIFASQQAMADSIFVNQIACDRMATISMPIHTSVNNISGQPFTWDDAFNFNTPQAMPIREPKAHGVYNYGDALSADTTKATLRYFSFTVQTPRYTSANLVVEGVKHYRLLHNDRGVSYINQLTPQRHTIQVAVLTEPGATDTLRIRFEGENIGHLVLHPTGKRPYTLADQNQGLKNYYYQVSPSGKYLYASYANTSIDGKPQYYSTISEIDSRKVLYRTEDYLNFSWLPTGEDRGYFTRQSHDQTELVVFDPVKQQSKIIARCLPDAHIRMAPTGEYLIIHQKEAAAPAFRDAMKYVVDPADRQANWRDVTSLLKYDLRTGVITRLTFGDKTLSLNDISPDGKKLLLTQTHSFPTQRPFRFTTAYLMDIDTQRLDTIVPSDGELASLYFTPDGSILAKGTPESFGRIGSTLPDEQVPNNFEYELFLLSPDGKHIEPLTKYFAPSIGHIKVHAASNKIYFSADDKYLRSLYTLDLKTKQIKQVPLHVDVVHNFDIAQHTSRVVYSGDWNAGSRNLYTADLAQSKPKHKQIGDTDIATHLHGVQTHTWKEFNFISERGDTIYGNYLLPYDFDPNKKYPTIIYYYGGVMPVARSFESAYPYQVWAAQGYVVYVLQPSGAVGFGQKFAAKHVNTWGLGSANDIMEGTQKFAEQHSFVDASKIGCLGASYGGFMTQYLVANSKLYAAAISHAGISNIASYWGSGTWGYSYSTVAAADSYPWNNPDLYTKHSPLFNADKITTPLLLLHGNVDNNVPPAESMQMYTALRLLGREVALIEFEGENHIINDFTKRTAWQTSIFAWFAKHLKGEPEWWDTLYPEQKQFPINQ